MDFLLILGENGGLGARRPVLVLWFFEPLRPEFAVTALYYYYFFCTQARSHSQLHTAAAVFPHPTPSYKLNYVTEERKEKKKGGGGAGA